jgi:aspartate racemase
VEGILKVIGLIGGMSWESSALYYRIINEEIRARRGGLHSAKCILYSVDFEEIEAFQRNDEWERAGIVLTEAARSLELAGAEFILLCTNTMHKVAHQIQGQIGIPLLHIADNTANQVVNEGIQSIGLLGTRYTMEQGFYKSRLEERGIKVLIPGDNDREIVNKVIFQELCLGSIREDSRLEFKRIINSLIHEGAEGIILGCTEIGLLVQQEDASVPLFDTTLIHAEGAVDYALE